MSYYMQHSYLQNLDFCGNPSDGIRVLVPGVCTRKAYGQDIADERFLYA